MAQSDLLLPNSGFHKIPQGFFKLVNKQMVDFIKTFEMNAKRANNKNPNMHPGLAGQVYAVQEIWINNSSGDYTIVDYNAKLSNGNDSILYCDLGQTHEEMKQNSEAPLFANPSTPDYKVYGGNNSVFLKNEQGKTWKAQ